MPGGLTPDCPPTERVVGTEVPPPEFLFVGVLKSFPSLQLVPLYSSEFANLSVPGFSPPNVIAAVCVPPAASEVALAVFKAFEFVQAVPLYSSVSVPLLGVLGNPPHIAPAVKVPNPA